MKDSTDKSKYAVIYARFSSHRQTEQSIEGQLHVCYDYAAREGYTVIGEYIDRALTGRSDDRPDFQRMIKDSANKSFQYVIVYKLDRFSRDRFDSAMYKHVLKGNGVKVVSAMENIGDNPESVILESLLEGMAEYYSLELSQKIKRGRRESASKGKFLGGAVPLGYRSENGILVVDEETAPAVKKIFAEYAAGVSKKDIIDGLNRSGMKNKEGRPYTYTALACVLKNEKYIGVLEQSGIRIEGAVPALTDTETFNKVQARLAGNSVHGARNKAKVDYLLSGKLFCGNCGSPMQGISGTGMTGNTYAYYQCKGRREKNGCEKKHEPKQALEDYVIRQTLDYILAPGLLDEISDAIVKELKKDAANDELRQMEKKISKLENEINKLIDLAGSAPPRAAAAVMARVEEYTAQRELLETEASKLRISSMVSFTKEEVLSWLRLFCDGEPDDPAFRKRLVDVFINSIYVWDDKIAIYYNVRGGERVSWKQALSDFSPPEEEVCISKAMDHQSPRNTNIVFLGHIIGLLKSRR